MAHHLPAVGWMSLGRWERGTHWGGPGRLQRTLTVKAAATADSEPVRHTRSSAPCLRDPASLRSHRHPVPHGLPCISQSKCPGAESGPKSFLPPPQMDPGPSLYPYPLPPYRCFHAATNSCFSHILKQGDPCLSPTPIFGSLLFHPLLRSDLSVPDVPTRGPNSSQVFPSCRHSWPHPPSTTCGI